MTRDAELYYLNDLDYTPIKNEIEFDADAYRMSLDLLVIKRGTLPDYYMVLSVSEKMDN